MKNNVFTNGTDVLSCEKAAGRFQLQQTGYAYQNKW